MSGGGCGVTDAEEGNDEDGAAEEAEAVAEAAEADAEEPKADAEEADAREVDCNGEKVGEESFFFGHQG